MLNWIYVDKDTYQVKYGNKKESDGHLLGPWNCTPVEKRLTFDGWEGFLVVEEPLDSAEFEDEGINEHGERPTQWALYFDVEDDGLLGKVPMGRTVLEVELFRKEMRIPPIEEKDEGPN
jgi:hypothetical protein